jgi:hypothetical protein
MVALLVGSYRVSLIYGVDDTGENRSSFGPAWRSPGNLLGRIEHILLAANSGDAGGGRRGRLPNILNVVVSCCGTWNVVELVVAVATGKMGS